MALITCQDCAQKVSDRAPACPTCGAPIAAQTIEATAKLWKALQVLGAIAMAVGLFGVTCAASGDRAAGATTGVMFLALVSGFMLLIGARVGAWWHHG